MRDRIAQQPVVRWKFDGVLAQLVERLNGIEEVRGSIPLGSIFFVAHGRAEDLGLHLDPELMSAKQERMRRERDALITCTVSALFEVSVAPLAYHD